MHKSTLMTYSICHSMKNNQQFGLLIPTGNSHSTSSFSIFQRNFVPIFTNTRANLKLVEKYL